MTSDLFVKPPLTYDQQIQLLKNRGLIIKDEEFARRVLQSVSYYRLSGYSLSLRTDDMFHPGVTFETIYRIYQFDRKLRYSLQDLIERVEISFRTAVAYYLAHTYGPLCYKDPRYFKNGDYHRDFLAELNRLIEVNAHKELFIRHHIEKYGGVFPIWVVIEVFPFGLLSKLYNNMLTKDKETIAKPYCGFSSSYLGTWIHSLVNVRNICAHYGRLYNRRLTVNVPFGRKEKRFGIGPNTVFANIFILKHLIKEKQVWTTFITNLSALIDEYEDAVDISLMGFPERWKELLKEPT